jgi:hypothetical protein
VVSSGRRRGKGAPRFCRRGTYVSRQSGATGPVSRTRIRPTGQALESLRSVQPSMPCSTAPLAWETHRAPQALTNEKRVCPHLALQKRGWGEMCPKNNPNGIWHKQRSPSIRGPGRARCRLSLRPSHSRDSHDGDRSARTSARQPDPWIYHCRGERRGSSIRRPVAGSRHPARNQRGRQTISGVVFRGAGCCFYRNGSACGCCPQHVQCVLTSRMVLRRRGLPMASNAEIRPQPRGQDARGAPFGRRSGAVQQNIVQDDGGPGAVLCFPPFLFKFSFSCAQDLHIHPPGAGMPSDLGPINPPETTSSTVTSSQLICSLTTTVTSCWRTLGPRWRSAPRKPTRQRTSCTGRSTTCRPRALTPRHLGT